MVITKRQSPSEKFEMCIRFVRFAASICGIDLFVEGYQMNWITYTLFTSIAGYFIFVFLTIYKNYQDDWSIILRASVTMGTALQGVSKLYSFISDKAIIQDLLKIFFTNYREYETKGDKYVQALEDGLKKTKAGLIFFTILYISAVFGMGTLPYVWIYLTGQHSLVLEFEVPGLDIRTDFGYYTTLTLQTILIGCFAFGLYCGDLGTSIYLLQSHVFANIFAAKIEYLNEMIENAENNKKSSVTTALKDIVKWHQYYSEYTAKCNAAFYSIITVQILSAFYSTVVSVYLIIAGAWPGAYIYVVLSFSCLHIYCILGTENELAVRVIQVTGHSYNSVVAYKTNSMLFDMLYRRLQRFVYVCTYTTFATGLHYIENMLKKFRVIRAIPQLILHIFVEIFIIDLFIFFKNEKFEREIYGLHWYNLNVPQQKIVLQVLAMTQKPQTIDIAGVAPLSVTTALSLTKAVYSITMFMIEFFLE